MAGFDYELLRENLARLLAEREMTPYALAKQANIDKANVLNIVNGKSKNPTMQTLYPIAEVLGCSLDELVGRRTMDAAIDEPINEKFLEAAIDALKNELQGHGARMTLMEWCDALKDIYIGIAAVKSRKKDSMNIKQSSGTDA